MRCQVTPRPRPALACLGLFAALVTSCAPAPAPRPTSAPKSTPRTSAARTSASVSTPSTSGGCRPVASAPELPAGARLVHGALGTHVVLGGGPPIGLTVTPAGADVRVVGGTLCADRPARVLRRTTRMVEAVSWETRRGVRSLGITPGWLARAWPDATDAVAAELRGRTPEIDRPGMRDQLRCHILFAPGKAVWHLEPARPDVGWAATVAARCNPGPQTDPDGR